MIINKDIQIVLSKLPTISNVEKVISDSDGQALHTSNDSISVVISNGDGDFRVWKYCRGGGDWLLSESSLHSNAGTCPSCWTTNVLGEKEMEREYTVSMVASVDISVAVTATSIEEAEEKAKDGVNCIEYANGMIGWESPGLDINIESQGSEYEVQCVE